MLFRSEGLLKDKLGDKIRVYSAGSNPSGVVHPMAIEVMKEIDVSIRRNKSQHWNDLPVDDYDLIVTVCDHAEEQCPLVPSEGGDRVHIPIEDPIHAQGNMSEIRQAFRDARDRIAEEILPAVEEWLSSSAVEQ